MASPARSSYRLASAIALSRTSAPRSRSPAKSSARESPAKQADPQLVAAVVDRRKRLLEQLDRIASDDPGAPARVLVADRRAGEQLRRCPAPERAPPPTRRPPAHRSPCPHDGWRRPARAGRRRAHARPGSRSRSRSAAASRRRRRQARRSPPAPRAGCSRSPARPRRTERLRRSDGRGPRVRGRSRGGALERFTDAQMQFGSAKPREPVIERPSDDLVGEAARESPSVELLDHPAADRLLERGEKLGLGDAGGAADRLQLELRPGGCRELEQLDGSRAQAGQPLADHLAHAFGRAELAERPGHAAPAPRRPRRFPAPAAARQSSQTRKALPAVRSWIVVASSCSSGSSGSGSLPAARLTRSETSAPESPSRRIRTTSSERRRSASVSESSAGTSGSLSRKVARISSRALQAERARCRRSRSVVASAQCPSSSTSRIGLARLTFASSSATAVCRRWRSVSASALTGCASSPNWTERSGSSRVSSLPPAPSAARSCAAPVTTPGVRAPRRRARTASARPRRRRRRGRARLPPRPRQRTRGPDGSSRRRARPRAALTRRRSPSARGISVRSFSSSTRAPDERRCRGRAQGLRKPQDLCLHEETIVSLDHAHRGSVGVRALEVGQLRS